MSKSTHIQQNRQNNDGLLSPISTAPGCAKAERCQPRTRVLSHELAPVQPSLFNDDRTMWKTTKADLSKKLESNCDEIQVLAVSHDNHTAYIIEGMTLLQTLAES